MELVTIFIISLGLSMDCFGVSIINGMTPGSIMPGTKLKAALSFAIFHFAMLYAGYYLGNAAGSILHGIDHWVAFVILLFVGIKMIFSNISIKITSKSLDINNIKVIIGLSIATSIDALIAGTAIPFLDLRIGLSAFVLAAVVFLLTFIGIHAGQHLGIMLGKRAGSIGGILLIGIGVSNLLPYLLAT